MSEEELRRLPDHVIEDIIRHTGENKNNFISSYFERLRLNHIPGAVSVPFYDTQNHREVFLPVNLLMLTIGSNGMAAGNTNAEAVFQALCELTERWAAAEIFYNQLTPPTVPKAFLKQFEEYDIIENIEKSGKYNVTVKDFSANKGIPAVGVIIENQESGKYRLNVGSDTAFQVGFSRCLTEIFQGVEEEEEFENILVDIPKEVPGYFKSDNSDAMAERYRVFCNFTKNASGQYPPGLFGSRPDYPFDPSIFAAQTSYEKEVPAIIANFHKNGYNVYIRDLSFLGFPSVLVYIPEVSVLGRKMPPIPLNRKNLTLSNWIKSNRCFSISITAPKKSFYR